MKKSLLPFLIMLLINSGIFAQRRLSSMINTTDGGSAGLVEKIGKKESQNAVGTPYTSTAFTLASINGVTENLLVKYNAESDEMEINSGDDKIFILPKEDQFNTITLRNTNLSYKLCAYKNTDGKDTKGYLVEKVNKNNVSLLKREKVILMPEKEAATSYSKYSPPKYERVSDEFYLQMKDKNIVVFPKNKKKLQELFPTQKSQIEDYLKTNDLSFKNENDMAKIVDYIATL